MKHIVKENSPEAQAFEAWKQTWELTKQDLINNSQLSEQKKETWEKLSGTDKQNVKLSLLKEQGFICCYCQRLISLDRNTIIEHFNARSTNPEQMFDYENMFACCDGGDSDRTNKIRTPVYCGAKKDDKSLAINPLDAHCEKHFNYIKVDSPDKDNKPLVIIEAVTNEGKDAIRILNLDNKSLREMRGEFIDGFIQGISEEEIEELLPIIKNKKADGKFFPFCVALEQILQNLQSGQDHVF